MYDQCGRAIVFLDEQKANIVQKNLNNAPSVQFIYPNESCDGSVSNGYSYEVEVYISHTFKAISEKHELIQLKIKNIQIIFDNAIDIVFGKYCK